MRNIVLIKIIAFFFIITALHNTVLTVHLSLLSSAAAGQLVISELTWSLSHCLNTTWQTTQSRQREHKASGDERNDDIINNLQKHRSDTDKSKQNIFY